MIGTSPAFQRMRNAARLVAATDVGVLVLGEPGSGRRSLAREIQAQSPRVDGPFIPFPCAGAPPGALAERIREIGAGATLFLDEVAELPPEDQARLLHVIATGDLGASLGPGPQAPRIIAASAVDLGQAAAAGQFRRDLYLRLCVVPIEVPPLRERVLDHSIDLVERCPCKHGCPACVGPVLSGDEANALTPKAAALRVLRLLRGEAIAERPS